MMELKGIATTKQYSVQGWNELGLPFKKNSGDSISYIEHFFTVSN